MTRKLSITTVVAVAALSVGAPAAFGAVHPGGEAAPVLAQPDPMIEDGFAQAVAQVPVTGLRDAHERGVASEPQWLKALAARSEGLNRQYGLGEYATTRYRDSSDRAVVSEPQLLQAIKARSEGLNKQYGLGEFATTRTVSDSFDRVDLPVGSAPVSVTATGNDVEWPQIGFGLGIGLLLALGLGLIMRTVHNRPFAH
jgi:hypothetical protein